LAEYDELEGIAWRWQSVDGASGKAPLAQECVGPNSTDRGKMGANAASWWTPVASRCRSSPAGPNRHGSYLLRATLAAIVCPRPDPRCGQIETLCADAAYVGFPAQAASRLHHYQLNVKTRRQERDEKQRDPDHKARGWVVERTHSWLNRFRKLLISFEKTEASYTALLSLAAALISWRQTVAIYGYVLILKASA
jgi:putative transposase